MPKKKRVKRRAVKRSQPVHKKAVRLLKAPFRVNRLRVVVRNLILFAVLFVISVVIAMLTDPEGFVSQLFWILAILTGFVGVALLIVLLVILFMKILKK